MWRVGYSLCSSGVISSHSIVDEVGWCDSSPTSDGAEGVWEGQECERAESGRDKRRSVGAFHAVDGDIVPLRDVVLNFVKGRSDSVVPVWNMAKVAFDPVCCLGDGEGNWGFAVVGDEAGIV